MTYGIAISGDLMFCYGRMKHILLATLLIAASAAANEPANLAGTCAAAAQNFLNDLDKQQRTQAAWPFDGDKRRKWTYFPNVPQLDVRNEGLILKAMSDSQRVAAHRLIECGLSSQGYQKAAGVIRLDDILGQTDLYRPMTEKGDGPVGSGNYWLAVFGDPAGNEPWGWQLEGHHLALNFTVVDNQIVFAPAFMGADPAEVPDGPYAGWRLLGPEVDKALLLVNSLTAQQRKQAILADEIPQRVITGPGRGDALKEYAGIKSTKLNAGQLALLRSLIDEYVQNASEPIAAVHIEQINKFLPSDTWFAWMGPTTPNSGIYYRVHSPALLIEFVTARDRQSPTRAPNPNHVHAMFRHPGNDFGDDLLRRHYETSPDHQHE
jgi:hypothetical protein